MAIKFKYDATGVVIPQNASNRKYGQALVLQQKRFEDEQKLLAQKQQMYNQPRRGMQQQAANRQQLGQQQGMANLNAGFGANMAPMNPAVFRDMAGPRRLSTRINNAQANANAVPMDPAAFQGMAAPDQMQEGMLAAQLQAQERAGFEEARKAGEYDPVTAAKIQQTYADATKTDMSKDYDAAQKAEWNAENNAKRSELLRNRNPSPSPEEAANRNLQYYVPSRRGYVSREQAEQLGPDVEVQVYEGGKPKPGVTPKAPVKEVPQLPQMYEEYKDTNYERHLKALDAKVEEYKSKALEPEGKQYADMGDQELEDAAYAELKGKYERDRARSAAGKPVEPTQPVTPPVAPVAPPSGMQNLEPSYNADGTTGQQVEKAIEDKLYPQGASADAAQVTPPQTDSQPVDATDSATPDSWAESMRSKFDESKPLVKPANVPTAGNPVEFMDESGRKVQRKQLYLDGTIEKRTSNYVYKPDGSYTIPPGVKSEYGDWEKISIDAQGNERALPQPQQAVQPQATQTVQPQPPETQAVPPAKEAALPVKPVPASATQPQSAVDMIGEVNSTFESGTPEQKAMLRQKMKSSDIASNLVAQARSGNTDAEKAMVSLEASLSPTDIVADEILASKKDGRGAVDRLQALKSSGTLDNESYTAAIVANSGKTAKQNYELFSGNAPGKYGTGSNVGTQVVQQSVVINALWSEMGMYDSRPYVRMFEKEPTVDEVIAYVAKKDDIPRKDAEEYVYNQLLSRGYAKEVQKDFEGSLTMDRSQDRERKEAAKRDAWTSKKPNKTEKK